MPNKKIVNGKLITLCLFLPLLLFSCSGSGEKNTERIASQEGFAKLQALHAHEDSILTTYKVLDRKKGIYQIPVEEALRILATERTLGTIKE